jgi:hypothetical protein
MDYSLATVEAFIERGMAAMDLTGRQSITRLAAALEAEDDAAKIASKALEGGVLEVLFLFLKNYFQNDVIFASSRVCMCTYETRLFFIFFLNISSLSNTTTTTQTLKRRRLRTFGARSASTPSSTASGYVREFKHVLVWSVVIPSIGYFG